MPTKKSKKRSVVSEPRPKKSKKAATIQSVKGMHDILPEDFGVINKIEKVFRDVGDYYSFSMIETPIVEPIELFDRSSGATSDVVEKEMFNLKTKGGDALALRPEGTPGVIRAYIEHGMAKRPHPVKLSYWGPFFRYQKPQAGRLRQFHQAGFEIISHDNDPIYDAQMILLTFKIIEALKIKNLSILINSVGCKSCRTQYRKHLKSYYSSKEKDLCRDCKRRLEHNPLRLLDCKKENCRPIKEDAPVILDSLCLNCKDHFKEVLDYLDNLELPYVLDHFLVRGLDYYTNTVFEILSDTEDNKLPFALAGGGRYDQLVEAMGGKTTAGIGVAMGVESMVEAMKHYDVLPKYKPKDKKVFFIHVGALAKKKSLAIIEELRASKINIIESLGKESLGSQMKNADKHGVPLALIFGQKEAYEKSIILRDMKTGAQEIVPLDRLSKMIKKRLD